MPRPRDRLPAFGILAVALAGEGILSGIVLAFHYAPTLDDAHASLRHLVDQVAGGGALRGLHHWCGTLAIACAAAHGWRLFWHGCYKAPRRALWALGAGIFLGLVGIAYTGYLLAGDERAYEGLNVLAGVAGSVPLIGDALRVAVLGGPTVSDATLARVYAMHAHVLPLVLLALVAAYARLRLRLGPPARYDARPGEAHAPATRRDAAAVVAALLLALALARFAPPALGDPADPSSPGSPDARPEWFFLWVNGLMREVALPTFVTGVLAPLCLAALALALPWILRNPERSPHRRKPEIFVAGLLVVTLAYLTSRSLQPVGAAPAPLPEESAEGPSFDERARAVMAKFKCAGCHVIDGDDSGDATGPALNREGFAELYTEKFFRLKVGDPIAFWPETGMRYSPPKRKPTPEELDLLVRWFFGDAAGR
jgi:quinol-cytochrome oxidoreductase complex cytochrome b subunit